MGKAFHADEEGRLRIIGESSVPFVNFLKPDGSSFLHLAVLDGLREDWAEVCDKDPSVLEIRFDGKRYLLSDLIAAYEERHA